MASSLVVFVKLFVMVLPGITGSSPAGGTFCMSNLPTNHFSSMYSTLVQYTVHYTSLTIVVKLLGTRSVICSCMFSLKYLSSHLVLVLSLY